MHSMAKGRLWRNEELMFDLIANVLSCPNTVLNVIAISAHLTVCASGLLPYNNLSVYVSCSSDRQQTN